MLDEQQVIETQNHLSSSEADEMLDKIAIQDALTKLPDELREIVVLYYFQDLKLAEISDILHIGLPLVKYRMKQAKLKLEQLLKEDSFDEF